MEHEADKKMKLDDWEERRLKSMFERDRMINQEWNFNSYDEFKEYNTKIDKLEKKVL